MGCNDREFFSLFCSTQPPCTIATIAFEMGLSVKRHKSLTPSCPANLDLVIERTALFKIAILQVFVKF